MSTARPKSKQKLLGLSQEEESATPVRTSKAAAAPKTEKAPRVKATTAKSRRKSAPNAAGGKKKKKLPAVDPSLPPEMDSDGDDPLLLVGTDEWLPVPWKPLFVDDGSIAVKKEEDEEAGFKLLVESSSNSSSSLAQDNSPAHQNGHDDHAPSEGPEPGLPVQSPSLQPDSAEEVFNQVGYAFSPSPSPALDADTSIMSNHPDGDSSFVGMEIDEDEDLLEFSVPTRLESPPARRRRSSTVSQRQETPGASGPAPPRPQEGDRLRTPPRSASVADMASPTRNNSLAGSILGQMSPGPLRLPPITPFRLKRKSVAPASPAPYPSPAFRGTKLGSLSPEKGRGPSRGALPALREDGAADEFGSSRKYGAFDPDGSASMEEDDGGTASERHSVQPTRTFSGNDQGNTSRAFADSEYDATHAAPANQVDDEDSDEDAENSMQVERQLTEGLSDDEPEMDIERTQPSAIVRASATIDVKEEDQTDAQTSPENSLRSDENQSHASSQTLVVQASWSSAGGDEDQNVLLEAHDIVKRQNDAVVGSSHPEVEEALMDLETESESDSDPDEVPLVEITSKDPMAAARAAAILKVVGLSSSYSGRSLTDLFLASRVR